VDFDAITGEIGERVLQKSAYRLTIKEEAFVRSYVRTGSQTQAYLDAGARENPNARRGSRHAASTHSRKFMRRPAVRRALEEWRAEVREKYEIAAEKVIAEMARIAFANLQDYAIIDADGQCSINLNEATRDELGGVAVVEIEERTVGTEEPVTVRTSRIKFHDKLKALEGLARHLGLFEDGPRTPPALSPMRSPRR
jgi:phage terminase small subunit